MAIRESGASINTMTDTVRLHSGYGMEGTRLDFHEWGEFGSLKIRLLKPHLIGSLISPLNKDIRNEKNIHIYVKSSERFLISERGTPRGIKTSEERDSRSGIQFAFVASSFSNPFDAPQKKEWPRMVERSNWDQLGFPSGRTVSLTGV